MYCSTCGSFIPQGRAHCSECGTRVGDAARRASVSLRYGAEDGRWVGDRRVGECPRCAYQGEGISYFSRGRNAAALVAVTVLTAGAMGAGGVLYYLVRRDHRVCPRCGASWGRHGERSLAPVGRRRSEPLPARLPPAERETSRRVWSIVLWILAVMFVGGGIAGGELVPLLFGAAAGVGGWIAHRAAVHERDARRAALLAELQLDVLRLAGERGGRLTVTEVAAALGWTLKRAEKVLASLDDGYRVDSEVTDDGVIVYEFLELLRAPRTATPLAAPELPQPRPDAEPPGGAIAGA